MATFRALDLFLEHALSEAPYNAKPEVPPVPPGLYNLRVEPELKEICRRANLRLSGRKSELLNRIERAWENDSPNGREAVRAVLRVDTSSRMSLAGAAAAVPVSTSNSASRWGAASASSSFPDASLLRCWCMTESWSRPASGSCVRCSECGCYHHTSCVHVPPSEAGRTDYVCAPCRATWLDPFSPVVVSERLDGAQLAAGSSAVPNQQIYLKPASPQQISGGAHRNSKIYDFDVAPFVCSTIYSGKRRLQIRCFLPNPPGGRQNLRWPLRTQVLLNNCDVGPVPQQPQAWDGHSYKDRHEDSALVVPHQLLRAGRNRLVITAFDQQPHIACLVLAETRTPEELVKSVSREHTLMPSAAHAHMKATFGDDDPEDDDVIAGPARLPLTCPLTHTRLTLPARGATCRHLECFDLGAYIELAKATSHPRWTCPLCNKPARPHQLRVDSWTANVLETTPTEQLEVEVQPDGSYGPVPERPTPGSGSAASRKRKAAPATAALELDETGGGSATSGSRGAGTSGGGSSSSSGYGRSCIVGAPAAAMQQQQQPPAPPRVVVEIDDGDDADHPIELSDDDD